MDEFFIGAIVDTPDGIGEVVEMDEEMGTLTVCLERTREEVDYSDFECDLLDDYPIEDDEDLDFDGDALDDEYEGDENEFRSEFGEDEE